MDFGTIGVAFVAGKILTLDQESRLLRIAPASRGPAAGRVVRSVHQPAARQHTAEPAETRLDS
jgi:hypothetical protein